MTLGPSTPFSDRVSGSLSKFGGAYGAYSCNCLHAEHEWVRSHVSGVGEGIFFP